MKAAVLTEYKKIEAKDIPEPQIGLHEIKFRVMACGICPNDYRLYTGLATWKKPPTILGHEPAGEVVEVGSEVERFKPGDMVAGDTTTRCGYCKSCLAGRENLCTSRRNVVEGSLAQFSAANENLDEQVLPCEFRRGRVGGTSFLRPQWNQALWCESRG